MQEAAITSADESPTSWPLASRLVDFGIAGTLFVAPLVMGGRYAVGRLVLVLLIAVVAICWFVEQTIAKRSRAWYWTGTEWLCVAAIALIGIQLLPLGSGMLRSISPKTTDLLPLWAAPSLETVSPAWPRWDRITVAPQATRGGMAMLIAYALLFLIVVQRVRTIDDVTRMLKGIAIAGVSMATIGLLQYFLSNGRFLWIYSHPSRDTLTAVKGTFANENHFAHFLALTIGPLLWWLLDSLRADSRKVVGFQIASDSHRSTRSSSGLSLCLSIGLGAVVVAGLLSYSRGGIAMMLLAALVTNTMYFMQGRVGTRALVALGSVLLVSAVAIWLHGHDVIAREAQTLNNASLESLDQDGVRRTIWTTVMRAIPDFALFGSGVGTHSELYPTYLSEEVQVRYSHAESGYLQVLLETGGLGFALLLLGIVWSGSWIAKPLRQSRENVAVMVVPLASSWIVSVVHAIFDFNWYIPANMTLTILMMAISLRLCHFSVPRHSTGRLVQLPPRAWGSLAVYVAGLTLFCASHYWHPAKAESSWNEYLAWSLASNRFEEKSLGPGRQRELGLVDATAPETIATMLTQLNSTVQRDPYNGQAHIRLAALCLRTFALQQANAANVMSLAEIRDAALTSDFPSMAERDAWISRAIGENRHTLEIALRHVKQGLRLCPLEGRGYVYLSEVAFLDPALSVSEYDLLHQAYLVRPNDPSVQFLFGRQKLLAGNQDEGTMLWKDAFRQGAEVRKQIIGALAAQVSPEELVTVFEPDLRGLRDLFDHYRNQSAESEQTRTIGGLYAKELEAQANLVSGDTAANLWLDAQYVHKLLGQTDAAVQAAQKSLETQPSSYPSHLAYALRLREAGRFEESIREFRWCQARRPEDPSLAKMLVQLQRELRATSQARQAGEPVR